MELSISVLPLAPEMLSLQRAVNFKRRNNPIITAGRGERGCSLPLLKEGAFLRWSNVTMETSHPPQPSNAASDGASCWTLTGLGYKKPQGTMTEAPVCRSKGSSRSLLSQDQPRGKGNLALQILGGSVDGHCFSLILYAVLRWSASSFHETGSTVNLYADQ